MPLAMLNTTLAMFSLLLLLGAHVKVTVSSAL